MFSCKVSICMSVAMHLLTIIEEYHTHSVLVCKHKMAKLKYSPVSQCLADDVLIYRESF